MLRNMAVRYSWKFLPLFISLFAHHVSSDLKFADWGQACKMPDPSGAELIETKYECDAGRGLVCQKYTQGNLCGCNGALSFDRRSQECRRKVSTMCHIPKDKEEMDRQSFNHKCHEDAECVIYSGTLLGGDTDRKKDLKPVCLCKQGFVSTTDFTECRDPNGTTNLQPSLLLFLLNAIGLYFLRSYTQN